MNTTFINQNSEGTIVEEGEKYLKSRIEDFKFFEVFGFCEDEQSFLEELKQQDFDLEEVKEAINQWESLSKFHEYGLSFDFVDVGTFDDQEEGYYRYQLSWGGPSDEIRFYEDGTIIYVYLDWYSGVGFDVSHEDWAVWLEDYFKDAEMIDFDSLNYEQKYKLEDEEV